MSVRFALALALAVGLVGCSTPLASPASTSCDGIDADVGGCAADRPVIDGTSCDEIGQQIGRVLNERILTIARGPAIANNESRAIRASHLMSVTVSLANARVRQLGITKECTASGLAALAAAQFSTAFKQEAGHVLYDGQDVSFQAWLNELESLLGVVDMQE